MKPHKKSECTILDNRHYVSFKSALNPPTMPPLKSA